jgi:ubiquinone/menaquinone biosynthesis C-methylase UbiE
MKTLFDMPELSKSTDVKKFGEDSFWTDRYANGSAATFEWFVSLKDAMEQSPSLKALLQSRADGGKARILEIGCGTSRVCEELWDLGFRDVTGLDYQSEAISFCKTRMGDRKIKYVVSDMRNLGFFEASSFDIIIDKGALDALVCHGGDNLQKCGAELWRVSKASSCFVVLSNAPLTEIPDGLYSWFERAPQVSLIKNSNIGQFMAKLYLFSKRKKAVFAKK